MSVLVTADLHCTDHPRDAHRWELFGWLAKQVVKHKAEAVLLLGDLTDAKDKHSAALTNRMVRELSALANYARVIIIKGNHDYIDETEPFFGFMDGVKRQTGYGVSFLTKPTTITLSSMGRCLFLPNTRTWEKDWNEFGWDNKGPDAPKFIFTHQTYDGCLTENGTRMEGIPPRVFAQFSGKVFSGDIHKPQKVGRNIEYVGAPYRCRFGDDYTPRVLLLDKLGATKDLHFPTKNKVLIKLQDVGLAAVVANADKYGIEELYENDQVKVRVELTRAQFGEWPKLRAQIIQDAADLGLELTGPEAVPVATEARVRPKAKNKAAQAQTMGEGAVQAYAQQKGAGKALCGLGMALYKQAAGDVA